jgi:hypothetical protein
MKDMRAASQLLSLGILGGCSAALPAMPPSDDEAASSAPEGPSVGSSPEADAGSAEPAAHDAEASVPAASGSFPHTAISACSLPNPAACPALPPSAIDPCSPDLLNLRCLYAGSYNRSALDISLHACELDVYGRYLWRPAPCQWNCSQAFERKVLRALPTEDCGGRTLQSCADGFLTPQEAVDRALYRTADECGLVSYAFGLTLSPEGCPETLAHSPSIMAPSPSGLECVAEQLAKLRFDCAPACALASGSLL